MKALTISEPWASKIANLEKFVENRFWATSYRGLLAIHAGKGTQYLTKQELKRYPAGCIVAVGTLSACVSYQSVKRSANHRIAAKIVIPGTQKTWLQVYEHPFTEGPQCWVLEEVIQLPKPISCRGAQGLWDLPPEIEEQLQSVLCKHRPVSRSPFHPGITAPLATPSG